jgi:hypothetical protein
VKRLGALEALGRGIANVRGNLEVVGVAAAGTIVLTGLVVLSLVPWLGLGEAELGGLFRLVLGQGEVADFAAVGRQAWTIVANLWGFLLAISIGLTVASVVYCWYFGGILGVLVAGEAQSPPGARRAPELFRTWSPRFFAGEAARLVWRLLGFYSLWLLLLTGVLALTALAIGLAAKLAGVDAGLAGLAVGCGASLPLIFLFLAALGAMSLGQIDLVAPESGVLAASRAGTRLLAQRLGAAVALFVLLIAAAMALGIFEAGLGLALTAALAGSPAAALAAQIVLFVVQVMLSTLLNLVFAAAFVALVRGERRPPAAAVA